jgi:hypothetical protein
MLDRIFFDPERPDHEADEADRIYGLSDQVLWWELDDAERADPIPRNLSLLLLEAQERGLIDEDGERVAGET